MRRLVLGLICLLLITSPALALPSITKDGKRVSIAAHLPKDKKAVVFFHAYWSDLSGRYLANLKRLEKSDPSLVVLMVDIKTLNSPVAKQYNVKSVPYFQIYDAKGELEKEGAAALNEVSTLLKE